MRRSANQILIFVADPPLVRHYCENSAILDENRQRRCRFSKSVGLNKLAPGLTVRDNEVASIRIAWPTGNFAKEASWSSWSP